MFRHVLRFSPLLAVILACFDASGPDTEYKSQPAGATDGTWPPTYAIILQRDKPLPYDIVRSEWIGPRGGSVHITEAGVKLEVPPNAVATRTRITVVAHAGSNIAYTFYPHGLVFGDTVAKIQQDLKGTVAYRDSTLAASLEAGYFQDPSQLEGELAKLDEIIPIEIKFNNHLAKFYIEHFSGYLVSSGRTTRSEFSIARGESSGTSW